MRIYKRSRKELRDAIFKSKNSVWTNLLSTIDNDPWGIPYRLVMKRLSASVNLTEALEEDVLTNLIDSLFPDGPRLPRIDWASKGFIWDNSWSVLPEEIVNAIKEKKNIKTAPGPDGISACVFGLFPDEFLEAIAACFTTCMRRGIFPDSWKVSRLVLIPKGTSVGDDIPKARPICLLNEIGKLFERVLAKRLKEFMSEDNVADLSPNQYGFRKAYSTSDALLYVKDLVKDSFSKKEMPIAVSLDVKNAFNSLPWREIRRSLTWRKHFPMYLSRLIEDYLHNRWIVYRDSNEQFQRREVLAGVPQGSVLGPLLWNITYDCVLRFQTFSGCTTICYADDTLLYVSTKSAIDTCELANKQLRRLIPYIENLGLSIGPFK